jgi:hypothetical protein
MRKFARKIVDILDSKPPRGARGQSLVELALTAPILFLMVIGIAEVGFLANNYLIAIDALREGGRFAVQLNPMSWHTSYTDPAGDSETRNQQRADCETTNTKPSGADYHVNAPDRDTNWGDAAAAAGGSIPHPQNGLHGVTGYTAGGETSSLGFYDGVMCQVVAALDPLFFDYRYDDIAISVISFANRCDQWAASGPGGCYEDPVNRQRPKGDHWQTVTGRFPLSNRKCSTDSRDPFAVPGVTQQIPVPGASNNDVRGYIVMGNMVAPSSNCAGSWFYLNEGTRASYGTTPEPYNLDYLLNTLPDDLLLKNTPSGAMVLVELDWNHHQLFNFPPFNLFNDTNTGGIRLHLWQVFPMVSAEPTPTG